VKEAAAEEAVEVKSKKGGRKTPLGDHPIPPPEVIDAVSETVGESTSAPEAAAPAPAAPPPAPAPSPDLSLLLADAIAERDSLAVTASSWKETVSKQQQQIRTLTREHRELTEDLDTAVAVIAEAHDALDEYRVPTHPQVPEGTEASPYPLALRIRLLATTMSKALLERSTDTGELAPIQVEIPPEMEAAAAQARSRIEGVPAPAPVPVAPIPVGLLALATAPAPAPTAAPADDLARLRVAPPAMKVQPVPVVEGEGWYTLRTEVRGGTTHYFLGATEIRPGDPVEIKVKRPLFFKPPAKVTTGENGPAGPGIGGGGGGGQQAVFNPAELQAVFGDLSKTFAQAGIEDAGVVSGEAAEKILDDLPAVSTATGGPAKEVLVWKGGTFDVLDGGARIVREWALGDEAISASTLMRPLNPEGWRVEPAMRYTGNGLLQKGPFLFGPVELLIGTAEHRTWKKNCYMHRNKKGLFVFEPTGPGVWNERMVKQVSMLVRVVPGAAQRTGPEVDQEIFGAPSNHHWG
jgi:hypothetical protein